MKTHSTMSRRDFMKALGLGATGVGATAVVGSTFRDLDELTATGVDAEKTNKRPWYVKTKDETTTEVDWTMIKRVDARYNGQVPATQAMFVGAERVFEAYGNITRKRVADIKANRPGHTLRDFALSGGSQFFMQFGSTTSFLMPNVPANSSFSTPEQLGVPKWQGTPEENSQMLRAALRFYGAGLVGFKEVTQEIKDKLFFTHHKHFSTLAPTWVGNYPPPETVSKRFVFEDVDIGYEGEDKYVFPSNVPLYDFCFTIPMSKELYRTANESHLMYAANMSLYRLFVSIQNSVQTFIRSLGYTCYGSPSPFDGFIPSLAAGQLTGIGESGRNNGFCITPEWGTINGFYSLVTDLPLASTKPIDAGIWRFCHTCNKCAETCPVDAIPKDKEPTYEPPDIYGKTDITHAAGKKQFWQNGVDCWMFLQEYSGCGSCMATCTFNTNNASIHNLVKSTLAITPLFNGFLWNADKFYGYGLIEEGKKEEWWSKSLPSFGWDSTFAARDGGY